MEFLKFLFVLVSLCTALICIGTTLFRRATFLKTFHYEAGEKGVAVLGADEVIE